MKVSIWIRAVDSDPESIDIQYQYHHERINAGKVAMPSRQLGLTDFEEALRRPDSMGLGNAAFRYGQILRELLSRAIDSESPLDAQTQLSLIITGSPSVHRWMWETLRSPEPGMDSRPLPASIVHLPWQDEESGHENRSSNHKASLVWIGSRPHAPDISRYRVLGPALAAISNSSLIPLAIRTDADLHDLQTALTIQQTGYLRIIHLDGHGASRIRMRDGAVEPEFSFALRHLGAQVEITDRHLIPVLATSECDIFLSNACFGAQQRGSTEFSFPARLVREGVRLAIAAREPLRDVAAEQFFRVFYTELSRGAEISKAFDRACEQLTRSAPLDDATSSVPVAPWDEAARLCVQPVIWARRTADLKLNFPSTAAIDGNTAVAAEYIALTGYGTLAELAEAIEDHVWQTSATTISIAPGPACGISPGLLASVTDELIRLIRPASNRYAPTAEGSASDAKIKLLAIPRLSAVERRLLVLERFSGPAIFIDLLTELLPEDVVYLDRLRDIAAGNALAALLLALCWGDELTPVAPSKADEAQAFINLLLAPSPGEEAATRNYRIAALATSVALPISRGSENSLSSVPLPRFPQHVESVASEIVHQGLGELVGDSADAWMIAPYAASQIAMRRAVAPEDVCAVRYTLFAEQLSSAATDETALRWDRTTVLACLTWMALGVASRQAE